MRPYREAKDTWLLGGVEPVAQLLDDSLLALGAIAASRYVGGIRWEKGASGGWDGIGWLICVPDCIMFVSHSTVKQPHTYPPIQPTNQPTNQPTHLCHQGPRSTAWTAS